MDKKSSENINSTIEDITRQLDASEPMAPTPRQNKSRNPFKKFKTLSTKKKIAVVVAVVLLLSGGSAAALLFIKKPQKAAAPQSSIKNEEPPKPTTEASRLTGVQVKPELNQRPVTAIMIENSPDARPQAALKDAGVVFEAIAEGGITRFLTLWQEAQPDYIGPVRSVRPYYVDWAQGFDAGIAHVGGSADGLAQIRNNGAKDLDQFANADGYWRVNTRYAPHNMYTSMAKLDAISKRKGYNSSTFDSFPRKEEKANATPTAKSLDFNVSSFLYNPHYDYDAATNTYKRSEGGKPHIDEKSGVQIAPKVVIAAVMNYGIAANGVNSRYDNIGSGKVYIFQDGVMSEGTWAKTSPKSQITFKDAGGNPIKLNAGQTWVSVVGSADRVVYKP